MNTRILDGSIIILYFYNPSVLFYFNLADSFIFCLLVSYQHNVSKKIRYHHSPVELTKENHK